MGALPEINRKGQVKGRGDEQSEKAEQVCQGIAEGLHRPGPLAGRAGSHKKANKNKSKEEGWKACEVQNQGPLGH